MTRPNVASDFWALVQKSDNCWEWLAYRNRAGYGQFKWHGRLEKAHRVSWMLTFGPIPTGLFVCHRCDVPACVRPEHLFLGTASDNNWDMARKGRHGRVGPNPEKAAGAKLNWATVREIRATSGTHRSVAQKYGVSRHTVYEVRRGLIWREATVDLLVQEKAAAS